MSEKIKSEKLVIRLLRRRFRIPSNFSDSMVLRVTSGTVERLVVEILVACRDAKRSMARLSGYMDKIKRSHE